MNVITAVSKLENIEVIHTKDYTKNERSISDNVELNCCVNLEIHDEAVFAQAKQRIENKTKKVHKKLQDMIKSISNKKYAADTADEEKLKDQEKVCLQIFY